MQTRSHLSSLWSALFYAGLCCTGHAYAQLSAADSPTLAENESPSAPLPSDSARELVADSPLGSGYDRLSGERLPSCLDPEAMDTEDREVQQTLQQFDVVNSKEDLAKKLSIEINAEASTSYGSLSGSVSSKTRILKSTTFSPRTIIGIQSLAFQAKNSRLRASLPALSPEALALLKADPKAFRLRCGDAYTRATASGASMYLLVKLTSKANEIRDLKETVNSVKVAFGQIWSATATTTISQETVRTLADFSITISCQSVGITTEACTEASTTVDPDDLGSVINFFNRSKQAFSASVGSKPERLVVVEEMLEDYSKPADMLAKKRSEVFYDMTLEKAVLKQLLVAEDDIESLCSSASLPSCTQALSTVAAQIRSCSRQREWADCEPALHYLDELKAEIKAPIEIGRVILWDRFDHQAGNGKSLTLDFDNPFQTQLPLEANHIYNLDTLGFEDRAAGFQSSLQGEWRLRLFEHRDGLGRCWLVGTENPAAYSLSWFNDRASSFRLEKAGAYATSCD